MGSAERRDNLQMFACFLVPTQNNWREFLKWRDKIAKKGKKVREHQPRKKYVIVPHSKTLSPPWL